MLLAYRPRVPLAQTTFGAAALRPRSSASPSGGEATHCARAACGSIRSAAMSKDSSMNQAAEEENIRCRRHNIETRHVSVSGQPAAQDSVESLERFHETRVAPETEVNAETTDDDECDALRHVAMSRVAHEPDTQREKEHAEAGQQAANEATGSDEPSHGMIKTREHLSGYQITLISACPLSPRFAPPASVSPTAFTIRRSSPPRDSVLAPARRSRTNASRCRRRGRSRCGAR